MHLPFMEQVARQLPLPVLCRGVWHAPWINQSLARTNHPFGARKSLKVCVTRFWKNQYLREATAGSCSLLPFRRLGSLQSEGSTAGQAWREGTEMNTLEEAHAEAAAERGADCAGGGPAQDTLRRGQLFLQPRFA